MKHSLIRNIARAAAFCGLVSLSLAGQAQIPTIPEIPKIPAFLPLMTDVPATQPLPIDGEWMINTIRKRIRIDAGRAYAVDSWLHLFVLDVQPMMVVLQELQRTGPGQYRGKDLPLMGELTATLMPDGVLNVSVAGILGPVSYKLIPVNINNRYAFDQEKPGYSQASGAPQYQQQPPQYQQYQQPQYQQPQYQQPQYQQQPQYEQQPQYQQPIQYPQPGQQGPGGTPVNPDQGQPDVNPWGNS